MKRIRHYGSIRCFLTKGEDENFLEAFLSHVSSTGGTPKVFSTSLMKLRDAEDTLGSSLVGATDEDGKNDDQDESVCEDEFDSADFH